MVHYCVLNEITNRFNKYGKEIDAVWHVMDGLISWNFSATHLKFSIYLDLNDNCHAVKFFTARWTKGWVFSLDEAPSAQSVIIRWKRCVTHISLWFGVKNLNKSVRNWVLGTKESHSRNKKPATTIKTQMDVCKWTVSSAFEYVKLHRYIGELNRLNIGENYFNLNAFFSVEILLAFRTIYLCAKSSKHINM